MEWYEKLEKEFDDLEENIELLFTFNGRQYVLRVANEKDLKAHEEKGWEF